MKDSGSGSQMTSSCKSSVCEVYSRKPHAGLYCVRLKFGTTQHNGPYLYFRYCTGTSLQLRLMRGVFSNANAIIFFNDFPLPLLQARPSPKLRIGIWPIPSSGREEDLNPGPQGYKSNALNTRQWVPPPQP